MTRHGDQLKLIDLPESLPNGLVYRPDFLTKDEEEVLLAYIENLGMPYLQFREFESKRRGMSFEQSFPTFLIPARNRVAKWLSVPKARINEAFVQEYPPGYGIGWHRDRETPLVVGLSLKGWARMRFRPVRGKESWIPADPPSANRTPNGIRRSSNDVVSFDVEPRSVYVMQKDIATRWQHSVAPVEALRYSITFRMI